MALTLSDDLKIYVDLGNSNIGMSAQYEMYLVSGGTSKLIYTGHIYYMGPTYIYYKDIILPYLTDYQWFRDLTTVGNTINTTKFWTDVNTFYVRFVFSTGNTILSETTVQETRIPTVELKKIPSRLPQYTPTESEFVFGWKTPATLYVGSTEDSYNSTPNGLSNTDLGHMIATKRGLDAYGLSYSTNRKSIWCEDNDDIYKLAVYDDHSRFFLIWITRENNVQCQPFCKRADLTESVSTDYMTNINNEQRPYHKNINFTWTLNSEWLTFDEHNVYESLLISPIVYLYDNETGKRYRVNVTNNEWTERNLNNTKKMFNLTVTCKLAASSNITY